MNGDVVYGDDAAFVEQPFLLGSANFVLEEGSSVDFDVHRLNPIFFHVVFRGAFLFKSGKDGLQKPPASHRELAVFFAYNRDAEIDDRLGCITVRSDFNTATP